jgi:phosphopantetheinyl transferase
LRSEPAYELLSLPRGNADQAELRAQARAHPRARLAAHASRSYSGALALVAWHTAAVGVDLERVRPIERAFAESICSPAERQRFGEQLDDHAFVTSLWSGKEALAKALGQPLAYDPRRLESPLGWVGGAAGRWHARQLEPAPGHLAWLVWALRA